jgi:hypothetical protein
MLVMGLVVAGTGGVVPVLYTSRIGLWGVSGCPSHSHSLRAGRTFGLEVEGRTHARPLLASLGGIEAVRGVESERHGVGTRWTAGMGVRWSSGVDEVDSDSRVA